MEHEAALLQAIPAIVISMDAEGRVTQWNQTATETLGLTEAEVRGQPWDALPLAWDRKRLRAALDTLSAGGVVAQIDAMAFRTRDGQGRVLGFKVSRFTSAEGPGFILAGLDVTRRKELERRVQRVERLEAIGQLAAGIAHEINTPIQFVGDNLGFIGDILERVLPVLPLLPASALSKQGVDLEFIC
jgi:two-component system NtrC family sensor kinase